MNTGAQVQIRIQQRAATRDAAGQPVGAWSDVCTPWADVRFPVGLSAVERVSADREVAPARCSVRIAWREGLSPGMRVLIGTDVLDIEQVLPDLAYRKHVDLVCTAFANQG
jgi:SPP1 family predicted phage head-tail adaptor